MPVGLHQYIWGEAFFRNSYIQCLKWVRKYQPASPSSFQTGAGFFSIHQDVLPAPLLTLVPIPATQILGIQVGIFHAGRPQAPLQKTLTWALTTGNSAEPKTSLKLETLCKQGTLALIPGIWGSSNSKETCPQEMPTATPVVVLPQQCSEELMASTGKGEG